MPSFPINRRFCTAATCWISRITNSEKGVVQCAPMVNVPHSPLYCNMWNLRVNTKKIMIFEKGRHTTCNFIYDNVTLDVWDQAPIVNGSYQSQC